jgi:hypothetical protein
MACYLLEKKVSLAEAHPEPLGSTELGPRHQQGDVTYEKP